MARKILLLGAGLVARPMVRHILEKTDFLLTAATRTVSKAESMIAGHPRGKAVSADVDDAAGLERLVADHDLTVSLVPWIHHPAVARMCIRHRRHMVTTSYVKDEMRALDGAAQEAGITILNEAGLDPGIDHMSAMRIIDGVKARGGRITSFESMCGALPSPSGASNPFGYKFSWSPQGVLLASQNAARFLRNGKTVKIPGDRLFASYRLYGVEGAGWFEDYPNRDSVPYREIYGIRDTKTMYRGTLRNPGWCETLLAIAALGLLDGTLQKMPPKARTYRSLMKAMLKVKQRAGIEEACARKIRHPAHSAVMKRLSWLGLFEDEPLPQAAKTPLDALAPLMFAKLELRPPDTDMVVMQHEFRAEFPGGHAEKIFSTLVDFGIPGGDTSVARTVSIPAAIGARLILDGRIDAKGVCVPVTRKIYGPILAELEGENIAMKEKTVPA